MAKQQIPYEVICSTYRARTCPRVQPGKIIALRSQPVQSRNPVSGSLVRVAEGDSYYQLDHTHVFYFGLDENDDAEEFRMGMCGSGVD